MGLRMKNLDIFVVHWKIRFLEGAHKKSNIEGELPKRGAWTFYRFKGGLARKRAGGVFEGGWYPNAHYVTCNIVIVLSLNCIL